MEEIAPRPVLSGRALAQRARVALERMRLAPLARLDDARARADQTLLAEIAAQTDASEHQRLEWLAWAAAVPQALSARALARLARPWQRRRLQVPHRRKALRAAYTDGYGDEVRAMLRHTPRGKVRGTV